MAGALLLLLAAYITVDAAVRFLGYGAEPKSSAVRIIVTAAALVVMPPLPDLIRTARELSSRALRADAFETITCAGLSPTTLAGMALNFALGWTPRIRLRR